MSTPNWTLFTIVVLLATAGLLVLSRASARAISTAEPRRDDGGESLHGDDDWRRPEPSVPTGAALLANVALTHGLLGVALVALTWYAVIPWKAVGIGSVTVEATVTGVGIGVGLYLGSETTTAIASRVGIEPDERLRAYLAPERPLEWVVLLSVILPLIAAAEELLFRGILIGALGAGFGFDPWGLAIGSSVLFGLAHSAQGAVGVAVTAALGLVLAAAFVLTGNLAVVVVAHYVVDALEFVIRESVLD